MAINEVAIDDLASFAHRLRIATHRVEKNATMSSVNDGAQPGPSNEMDTSDVYVVEYETTTTDAPTCSSPVLSSDCDDEQLISNNKLFKSSLANLKKVITNTEAGSISGKRYIEDILMTLDRKSKRIKKKLDKTYKHQQRRLDEEIRQRHKRADTLEHSLTLINSNMAEMEKLEKELEMLRMKLNQKEREYMDLGRMMEMNKQTSIELLEQLTAASEVDALDALSSSCSMTASLSSSSSSSSSTVDPNAQAQSLLERLYHSQRVCDICRSEQPEHHFIYTNCTHSHCSTCMRKMLVAINSSQSRSTRSLKLTCMECRGPIVSTTRLERHGDRYTVASVKLNVILA